MSRTLFQEIDAHPFVSDFDPEQRARLAALARKVRFDAGQVIFQEGDDFPVLCLLETGSVALELEAPGRTLRVQTLSGGDVLDWSALLPQSGKHFQARAIDAVTAIALEGDDLLAAFSVDPPFGMAFMLRLMGVVSERLRATRVQLLDLYATGATHADTNGAR